MYAFSHFSVNFDQAFRVLGVLGAIATFLWTVYVWRDKSRQEIEASAHDAELARMTRHAEATKPFLERQLELYTVVTQTAATITASRDAEEVRDAIKRFWQLYSGELVLVENEEVAAAMRDFSRALPSVEELQDMQGQERVPNFNAPWSERG